MKNFNKILILILHTYNINSMESINCIKLINDNSGINKSAVIFDRRYIEKNTQLNSESPTTISKYSTSQSLILNNKKINNTISNDIKQNKICIETQKNNNITSNDLKILTKQYMNTNTGLQINSNVTFDDFLKKNNLKPKNLTDKGKCESIFITWQNILSCNNNEIYKNELFGNLLKTMKMIREIHNNLYMNYDYFKNHEYVSTYLCDILNNDDNNNNTLQEDILNLFKNPSEFGDKYKITIDNNKFTDALTYLLYNNISELNNSIKLLQQDFDLLKLKKERQNILEEIKKKEGGKKNTEYVLDIIKKYKKESKEKRAEIIKNIENECKDGINKEIDNDILKIIDINKRISKMLNEQHMSINKNNELHNKTSTNTNKKNIFQFNDVNELNNDVNELNNDVNKLKKERQDILKEIEKKEVGEKNTEYVLDIIKKYKKESKEKRTEIIKNIENKCKDGINKKINNAILKIIDINKQIKILKILEKIDKDFEDCNNEILSLNSILESYKKWQNVPMCFLNFQDTTKTISNNIKNIKYINNSNDTIEENIFYKFSYLNQHVVCYIEFIKEFIKFIINKIWQDKEAEKRLKNSITMQKSNIK